jgi:hypothetical protein
VQSGLEREAEIALYANHLPANLPPQIEWISDLDEALAWTDYLAVDLPQDKLVLLRSQLGILPGDSFPFPAQVLITQAMPCGIGACYACALKSTHGWILSCREGPVFDLNQLEL